MSLFLKRRNLVGLIGLTKSIRLFSSISQKEKIFDRINKEIGHTSKPFVEYVFTKPAWRTIFKFVGKGSNSAINPYGHASVRYCIPGKLNTIMNVSGVKNDKLVNFLDPEKFLFTDDKEPGNEQGGIFNRSFVSIRIDNLSEVQVEELDTYYKNIQKENLEGKLKYGMIFYVITNLFRPFFHSSEKGNCSCWTSKGLVKVGLLPTYSNWPLMLWFKLLWHQSHSNFKDTNIIAYRSIRYKKEPKGSLLYPFWGLNRPYEPIWDLDSFANIIVEPRKENLDNNTTYTVEVQKAPHIRERWNHMRDKLKNLFNFK